MAITLPSRGSRRSGISAVAGMSVLFVITLALVAVAYLNGVAVTSQNSIQQTKIQQLVNDLSSQNATIAQQQGKISSLVQQAQALNATQAKLQSLPVMDQGPRVVRIVETWELSPEAKQDRFTPYNIVVNQGDTVQITFIVNDSAGHTWTLPPPYNFQINDSAPGMTNDLTGKTFTTHSIGNSAGVVVTGGKGNLTGVGSFVAKYPGIYMFFCVYHIQLGMFGYLIVLPNKAYNTTAPVSPPSTNVTGTPVTIVDGAYNINQQQNYVPDSITVVIGVNNTVTWTNKDVAAHTVTSDTGLFNSGNMNPGESWTYTFTTPGTYSYHCDYHPWMKGTVVVKAK